MNLEDLKNAKKLFFIILSLDIIVAVICGFNVYLVLGTMKDIRSSTQVFNNDLINELKFLEIFRLPFFLTTIFVGFGLVKWLNSCYRFASESIGATGFKNKRWTIAAWIIPVLSLFKPYQIINEIYKVGSTNYSGCDGWKQEDSSTFLLLWWFFWIVTHTIMLSISIEILENSTRSDQSLSQLTVLCEILIFQLWIYFFIDILWFVVVNHLTNRLIERSTKPFDMDGNTSYSKNELYNKVYDEIKSWQLETGIWTRAFANADGNRDKAIALYIKYRIEQLKPHKSKIKILKNIFVIALYSFSSVIACLFCIGLLSNALNQPESPISNTSKSTLSKPDSESAPEQQEYNHLAKRTELTKQEYYEKSQKFLSNKNFPQLEEHCIKWVTEYPNDSTAWNFLGIAYSYNNKYYQAIEAYKKALQMAPGDKIILDNIEKANFAYENDIFSQQAKKYFDNNEWFALENYCLKWTGKYQNNPVAWNYLGNAYYNNRKYDKSLNAYKKALEFAPDNNIILENIQTAQYSMQTNSYCIKTEQGFNCMNNVKNRPPQENNNNIHTYPILCPPGHICPPFD